jgi:hypothetical protein
MSMIKKILIWIHVVMSRGLVMSLIFLNFSMMMILQQVIIKVLRSIKLLFQSVLLLILEIDNPCLFVMIYKIICFQSLVRRFYCMIK